MPNDDQDPLEYPINGILDLHQFRPREIKVAVNDYIDCCLERKIYALRIIHGKGIGVQREIVHAILKKHPSVRSFRHEEAAGGWGATVVDLVRPKREGNGG